MGYHDDAMPLDPNAIQVHINDPDNVVATYHNAMVQVRTGRMTRASLTRIESTMRLLRSRHKAGNVGLLAVVEDSAEPTDEDARERQREVIRTLLSDPRSYGAAVMPGSTTRSIMVRSFVRMLVLAQPSFHIANDVEGAARWLSDKLAPRTPDELIALVEHARSMAACSATT